MSVPVLADVVFTPAQVVAAVVAGKVGPISYWYEGLSAWLMLNPAVPPSAPQGTNFHLLVGWGNLGNVAISGHIDLTVTRPDGTTVTPKAVANQDLVAWPNNGWLVGFDPVALDQAGLYQGRAVLSTGTTILDDVLFPFAQVSPLMVGSIFGIDYWYEGLPGYTRLDPSSPPVVPVGTFLSLASLWKNESSGKIRGYMELTVTKPDGTKVAVAVVAGQGQLAYPGEYSPSAVFFEPVKMDQVGSYSGRLVLSGEAA